MRRILLDENTPAGVRVQLPGLSVATVPEVDWAGLTNGDLLAAANRAGFDVMVTGDQNMKYQNSLSGQRLALVVLSTTHWPTIQANPQLVGEAIAQAAPGTYAVVAFHAGHCSVGRRRVTAPNKPRQEQHRRMHVGS